MFTRSLVLAKHFNQVSSFDYGLCLLWLELRTTLYLILYEQLLHKLTFIRISHVCLLVEVFLFALDVIVFVVLSTVLAIALILVMNLLLVIFKLLLVHQCKMLWTIMGHLPAKAL